MMAGSDDWLWDDSRAIWTFKPDLNITLRENYKMDNGEYQRFHEEWATKFPDPKAYRTEFELWYASSFVKSYLFVYVDGCRASLPCPESPTKLTVTTEQLAIANVVNGHLAHYPNYITRFEVRD